MDYLKKRQIWFTNKPSYWQLFLNHRQKLALKESRWAFLPLCPFCKIEPHSLKFCPAYQNQIRKKEIELKQMNLNNDEYH